MKGIHAKKIQRTPSRLCRIILIAHTWHTRVELAQIFRSNSCGTQSSCTPTSRLILLNHVLFYSSRKNSILDVYLSRRANTKLAAKSNFPVQALKLLLGKPQISEMKSLSDTQSPPMSFVVGCNKISNFPELKINAALTVAQLHASPST